MNEIFTAGELREFARNRVWKSMVEEAMERLLVMSEESDSTDPVTEPTKIARYQGAKVHLLWLIDLPRLMLEEAESEEKKMREERGEKDEDA